MKAARYDDIFTVSVNSTVVKLVAGSVTEPWERTKKTIVQKKKKLKLLKQNK